LSRWSADPQGAISAAQPSSNTFTSAAQPYNASGKTRSPRLGQRLLLRHRRGECRNFLVLLRGQAPIGYTEKGRGCAPRSYRMNSSVESLYGWKFLRLSRQLLRISSSVTTVFGAYRTA
jgi:hypothetical protein